LKRRQKICLNLLIKKKRIAQLINGKPGKNRYNKTTREQHLKPATSKPTCKLNLQQRAHNTWSTTTQRRSTQLDKPGKSNGIHQTSSCCETFQVKTIFFLLVLRNFSTFLIISLEAFPAKTHAMFLPYPGLAASKLASNPQSSLAKRASDLCASTAPLTKEAGDCGSEVTKASEDPTSNGSSLEDYSHNS
jgi:hypothetical protein